MIYQLVWVSSHGVGLKSNQLLVGYSSKLCAPIVPGDLAGTTALQIKVLCLAWCLHFSFKSMQSVFRIPRM